MFTKNKFKIMTHVFTDPISGEKAMTPWSIESAIENGRTAFMDRAGCEECGTNRPKTRFVEDGSCVGCHIKRETEVFNMWLQGMPGRPVPFCTSREQAEKAGQDWYFGEMPVCNVGPHFNRKHVKTGRCIDCDAHREKARALARGPRAAARAAGHTAYIPNEACPECGERSPRNVVTNACLGLCVSRRRPRGRPAKQTGGEASEPAVKSDGRRTPTTIMIEMCPEMIISRDDARKAGFTQYRTGDPCRRGHAGWRYVSIGTCVQCARGPK